MVGRKESLKVCLTVHPSSPSTYFILLKRYSEGLQMGESQCEVENLGGNLGSIVASFSLGLALCI